jgi:hypothetical protein
MNAPFILRFQEPCTDSPGRDIRAGTLSITAVRAEATDEDPDPPPKPKGFGIFNQPALSAGTKTKTAVAAESSDADPAIVSLKALPTEPSLGTHTLTRIRAEGGDQDPDAQPLPRSPRVIPTCSSF